MAADANRLGQICNVINPVSSLRAPIDLGILAERRTPMRTAASG